MHPLIYFTIFSILTNFVSNQSDGVRLTEIPSLKFTLGAYTTFRRTSAVPQLLCTGGSAGCNNQPSSATCYNRGIVGSSVQWQCFATPPLQSNTKFGTMVVNCEGYSSSTDPYVLVGSCGLRYNLESISISSGSNNAGLIAGVVIGGILLIVGIVLGVVCCKRGPLQMGGSSGKYPISGRPIQNQYYHNNHSIGGGGYHNNTGFGGGDTSGGFASTETR